MAPVTVNHSFPFRLIPDFKERVWGVTDLTQWFAEAPKQRIGEAWFTAETNATAPGASLTEVLQAKPQILGSGLHAGFPRLCPLLVKFLFTSSRLSVQVHPEDDYAQTHHQSLGKTEAWFVIDAEPGATVALGFREAISPERLRSSAESGEIEQLLDWRPVTPGDVVFVPAGTVHALGSGLTVCEIQQNSDITYRLYDYGRPRELHLDHGCAVSDLGPHVHHFTPQEMGTGRLCVAECDYFRIEHLQQAGRKLQIAGDLPHYCLLVALRGSGTIAGQPFERAQVWLLPAAGEPVDLESSGAEWLLTYAGTETPPPIV